MKIKFASIILCLSLTSCGGYVSTDLIPYGEALCKVAGGELLSTKANKLGVSYVCKDSSGKKVTITVN